jgi:nitrogen-specific signal transduction histidine kinase/ActR/RegA family two-component response regulator
MVQDITARKQAEAARVALEEQLRQTQKLEALGQLAGGVAHDFNNILTGIVAYTELAQMDADNPDDVRRHLGAVRKASDRATDLVRQILTFSRQQPPERQPIRLAAVVTEATRLLRSSIPATIVIEEQIDPSAPIVLADKSQIHQVVMNLGTNAAHAMKGGAGRLVVSLERAVVGPGGVPGARNLVPGGHARISVTDTGHGMSEATLERIFDPFFTTKLPGEGTGLGLAVVHGIVRDHQGAITVRSRPGEGTCFEVYLPEHAAPAAEEAVARRALPKGSGELILLVDDEAPIVFASSILLRRLGYTVVAHGDPREAWQAFAGAPDSFAAVISDMTMPHLTGIELAGRIFDLRPGVPVILTTGFSGSWTPEALQTIGVRRLVPKPISAEMLAFTLDEVLKRQPR